MEKNIEILRLYLEKLELLTPKEREIILKAIELLSTPIYYATNTEINRIIP